MAFDLHGRRNELEQAGAALTKALMKPTRNPEAAFAAKGFVLGIPAGGDEHVAPGTPKEATFDADLQRTMIMD